MKTEFIELSGKINNSLPKKIVKKCNSLLKRKKNKKILIIGAAYKKKCRRYERITISCYNARFY